MTMDDVNSAASNKNPLALAAALLDNPFVSSILPRQRVAILYFFTIDYILVILVPSRCRPWRPQSSDDTTHQIIHTPRTICLV